MKIDLERMGSTVHDDDDDDGVDDKDDVNDDDDYGVDDKDDVNDDDTFMKATKSKFRCASINVAESSRMLYI